jgi:CheY-like chemotaxis protein
MNCPRCQAPIGPLSDPDGIVTCPGCGSRLMTRAAALRSQGGPKRAAAAPGTQPPVPPVTPAPASPARATARVAVGRPTTQPPVAAAELPPSATLPPTPVALVQPRQREGGDDFAELVLRELRALRESQERILRLLERSPAPAARLDPAGASDEDVPAVSPIRAGSRKSVLLLDDDDATRETAVRQLELADIPVRAFSDGHAAIEAIAAEKPDVIAIELALEGDLAGKDVINMIKATMEWVDVPIVLWTRENVANQKEARQIHGADEIVAKSAGAAALVARVITVFRRA